MTTALRNTAFALAATLCVQTAPAQQWPARPILTIYPFAPGSGGDGVARLVSAELSPKWGQSIVVENRPGGSGMLGYLALKNSKPDGYTLSYLHNGITVIRRAADPAFTADVGKDYDPVIDMYENFPALAAHPSAPFKNFREFVAYAKANPGKINIARGGMGSADSISAEMLKDRLGIDVVFIHYASSARGLQAVVAGETHGFITSSTMQSHVDGKRLIPLAALSNKPVALLPGWPPLSEFGIDDYKGITTSVGLFAPHATPRDVVMKINQAINGLMKDPAVSKKMIGVIPTGGTPEQQAERIRNDITNVGPVAQRFKITFD